MSLSKGSKTSSIGSRAQVKFPFELDPPIQKLTFGHQYAVKGHTLSETITFVNKSNDQYKMTITPSTSPKYTMDVEEEKVTIKKKSKQEVTIEITFNTVATIGLTGSVTFEVKKKALIGSETSTLVLRFQMIGILPSFEMKEISFKGDGMPLVLSPRSRPAFTPGMDRAFGEDSKEGSTFDLNEVVKGVVDEIKMVDVVGKIGEYKGNKVVVFKHDPKESSLSKNKFTNIIDNYVDIHHANIVQTVGVNYDSRMMLLEYDTICTLEQIMDKPIPLFYLTRCYVNLAVALQYLSSEGIMHRNVKPSKLRVVRISSKMIGSNVVVKLHDFSCAYKLKEGEEMNKKVGTLEYMAPEIVEQKNYGLKVDIFSLGMTILHIFTGVKPYEGLQREEIEERIKNGDLCDIPEKLPPIISNLIQKCCEINPDKRIDYKSIINHLNEYARSLPM